MNVRDDAPYSTSAPPRKSGGVLHAIESESVAACKQLLNHMFAATDDLFYELSKRATSNNEQNLYFESMREIRIKKAVLNDRFTHYLHENFLRLEPKPKADVAPPGAAHREDHLSIVDSDVLEVDLAAKNMANRTRESFKQETYELAVRLDQLLLQVEVNETNNPLDPLQISQAFVSACVDSLKVDIKARLILFKLFEKHVLKQLGSVFADANRQLVDAGILPKVPKTYKNTSADAAPKEALPENEFDNRFEDEQTDSASAHTASGAGATSQPQVVVSNNMISITPAALTTLMEAVRHCASATAGVHYHIYCNNPGPFLSVTDLASGLSRKQPIIDKKIAKGQPQNVLHTLITDILSKHNIDEPSSLPRSEEETINLVALFFDKLISDKKLPLMAQSLICRLQIPVLKVALNDRDFFSTPTHPARQLINAITRASMQFDSSKTLERDPLYRTIIDGVQTINRQYKISNALFEQVLKDVETLLNSEERKSRIVERRTEQTETGKAKVKHAKAFAQSIVFEKMKDEQLPKAVSEFITQTWLQVMVITFIREGKDSARWVEHEQLISDLIWLTKPMKDERSKTRAVRLKPEILTKIEQGLCAALDNPEARNERILAIESVIDKILYEQIDVAFEGLSEQQKQTLGRSADSNTKAWGDMTAHEKQNVTFEELSSDFYLKAKNVEEGTWVEYVDDHGKAIHCKLCKKIDSEIYIFVNRFGFKTLEKTRREFAYDMQANQVKLLDNTPLFDRIMDGIFSHFQIPVAHTPV